MSSQADIDVIGNKDLPDHYEVENSLLVMCPYWNACVSSVRRSHRACEQPQTSEGFYRGLGFMDIEICAGVRSTSQRSALARWLLLSKVAVPTKSPVPVLVSERRVTAADGKELSDKPPTHCVRAGHDIAFDSDAYVLARRDFINRWRSSTRPCASRPAFRDRRSENRPWS